MDVNVQNLREKKVFTVHLQPDSTIHDLRKALAEKYDVDESRIKLLFKSSVLSQDNELVISIDFEKSPIQCFIKPSSQQNKSQQTVKPTSMTQANPQPQPAPHHQPVIQEPDSNDKATTDMNENAMREYEVLSSDPVNALCSMGFSQEQVMNALRLCQNNLYIAQELLLSGDVSQQGLQNFISQNYSSCKQEIVQHGNKLYKYTTYTINVETDPKQKNEADQMIQSLLQIYNEMDENDKQNVNTLKDMGVNIADAIYAYVENQYNLDAARQYIVALKNQFNAVAYNIV